MPVQRIRRPSPLVPLLLATIGMGCFALQTRVLRADGISAPLILGAIRWDAWHGNRSEVGEAVEHSLSPAKWHNRLPFFARVLSTEEAQIDGDSQRILDREIRYARAARLDYWAFLIYEPGSAMNHALEYYLSSSHKRGLSFCLIVEQEQWRTKELTREWSARIAALAVRREYQLVDGGRPLLYVLASEPNSAGWGARHLDEAIGLLRAAFRSAGRGEPYVVILDYRAARAHELQAQAHADAIGAYAYQRDGRDAPFTQLASEVEKFWGDCEATGSSVVPIVMTGWDRRPRVERPVFWETWQRPNEGLEKFYAAPTRAELTAHARAAMKWVRTHPRIAPAKALLIYAWNENDEGGWLVPTLQDGTSRIQAVRRAVQMDRQSRVQ